MRNRIVYIVGLLLVSSWAIAEERPYLCEIGLQGGLGYYAGEAAPHIFQNVSYAAERIFGISLTRIGLLNSTERTNSYKVLTKIIVTPITKI